MRTLWSANTSVAHCDAGTMDGGVHLITHVSTSIKRTKGKIHDIRVIQDRLFSLRPYRIHLSFLESRQINLLDQAVFIHFCLYCNFYWLFRACSSVLKIGNVVPL